MPDLRAPRTPIPTQLPEERCRNFEEVALGYTEEMAVLEANRCLQCKNSPCISACPVGIDIPGFISRIREHDHEGAYEVLARSTSLAAICGRVCPQESQCEGKCVRGIKGESVAIGRLERFAADRHRESAAAQPVPATPNGHKIAVIGAGPGGLTCAGDLSKKGYDVTVFEALHVPGGVLRYGIPEFRLPKSIVDAETETLKQIGVKIECNTVIGKTITVDELLEEGYEALFIATGAGLPRFMGIPGESLKGVCSANEFLTRVNLMGAWKPDSRTPVQHARRAAVVGGGNVAVDAARCIRRLGAEQVTMVYRRSRDELPARKEEIEHAEEEGIELRLLCNPVEILGDENGQVRGLRCVEMTLGEPDESGRRRPVVRPDSEFELECDMVIMSIGTAPNPLIRTTTPGLAFNRHGCIEADSESGLTSRAHIYAGGDAVTGAATVIQAMGAGKRAAEAIDREICGEEKE